MLMNLSPAETSFLEKRSKLTKQWPWVGSTLLVVIIAFTGWLWISVPHLVNPWAVAAGLQAGTLTDSTISLMAAILPIVMLTLLAFVALTVVLAFVAFANERRLIQLISRQVPPSKNDAGKPTE